MESRGTTVILKLNQLAMNTRLFKLIQKKLKLEHCTLISVLSYFSLLKALHMVLKVSIVHLREVSVLCTL